MKQRSGEEIGTGDRQEIGGRNLAGDCALGDAGRMGASIWYFLREAPGESRSVPLQQMQRFFDGRAALPRGEDDFIRAAEVAVLLEQRRAVALARVIFPKFRVLRNGRLDPEHSQRAMAAGLEAAMGALAPFAAAEPGLIYAEHRFAKREYETLATWKPTEADLKALRELVNRRARARLM